MNDPTRYVQLLHCALPCWLAVRSFVSLDAVFRSYSISDVQPLSLPTPRRLVLVLQYHISSDLNPSSGPFIHRFCISPFSPPNSTQPPSTKRYKSTVMSTALPPGIDERYRTYYELYSRCNETSCPDEFYDYTISCTVQTCPIESAYFDYLPSLAANGVFIALFALALACYLGQGLRSRKFIGFTIAMVGGCILEVLGYAGRIRSYYSPWNQVRSTVDHTGTRHSAWPQLTPPCPRTRS
jgi:hypothetical protein